MASKAIFQPSRVSTRVAIPIPVRSFSYKSRLQAPSTSTRSSANEARPTPSSQAGQASQPPKVDTAALRDRLNSTPDLNLDFARGQRPRAFKPASDDADIASLLADLKSGTQKPGQARNRSSVGRGSITQPVPYHHPTTIRDLFGGADKKSSVQVTTASPVPLGPRLGKTVKVDRSAGMDVARAFSVMENICGRNRIKSDLSRQRFHERPGRKRKRLHSERWRKRFKESFKGICKRVLELKRQGW